MEELKIEVSMARIRDSIKMSNKIIPMMNNDEINEIATLLLKVAERIMSEKGAM